MYFGVCGGLLEIGILFILINFVRADFNITNRYFREFLFNKNMDFRFVLQNRHTFFKVIPECSPSYPCRRQILSRRFGVSDAPKCSRGLALRRSCALARLAQREFCPLRDPRKACGSRRARSLHSQRANDFGRISAAAVGACAASFPGNFPNTPGRVN